MGKRGRAQSSQNCLVQYEIVLIATGLTRFDGVINPPLHTRSHPVIIVRALTMDGDFGDNRVEVLPEESVR